MTKTLKELLHEKHPKTFNALYGHQVISLMGEVREQTLKECAEFVGNNPHNPILGSLKSSILSLDKNSIDIQP